MEKKEFFKTGYDFRGFDVWGRNKNGTYFDENGLTKDGFNRCGIHYKTHTYWNKEGYDAMGFASHPNFQEIQEKKRKREEFKAAFIQKVKEALILILELISFIWKLISFIVVRMCTFINACDRKLYKNRFRVKMLLIDLLKCLGVLAFIVFMFLLTKAVLEEGMIYYCMKNHFPLP